MATHKITKQGRLSTMNTMATVLRVKRLNNTVEGNPVYKLITSEGDYTTQRNNSIVYSFNFNRLENGDVVKLVLSNRGTITDIYKWS